MIHLIILHCLQNAILQFFESGVREEKSRKAMDAKIEAIERNDTGELIYLPKKQKTIGVK